MNREIYYVQNPSLGAAIIWKFVCGYYKEEKQFTPFPLLFIVLPIIFRKDLCNIILGTQKRSGLMKMSEKLFLEKANDKLYYVHLAADNEKELTLKSIRISLAAHLVALDMDTAMIMPVAKTLKGGISDSTKNMLKASERLGIWCSRLSLHEICTILKVRF